MAWHLRHCLLWLAVCCQDLPVLLSSATVVHSAHVVNDNCSRDHWLANRTLLQAVCRLCYFSCTVNIPRVSWVHVMLVHCKMRLSWGLLTDDLTEVDATGPKSFYIMYVHLSVKAAMLCEYCVLPLCEFCQLGLSPVAVMNVWVWCVCQHRVSQEEVIRQCRDQKVKDLVYELASVAHSHLDKVSQLFEFGSFISRYVKLENQSTAAVMWLVMNTSCGQLSVTARGRPTPRSWSHMSTLTHSSCQTWHNELHESVPPSSLPIRGVTDLTDSNNIQTV